MTTKGPKKTSKTSSDDTSKYNGWRVLAMVVEGVFGLFNSNKIYPAFGVLIFLFAGLVAWRLPETELAPLLRLLIEQVGSSWGMLLGLLVATNIGWYVLFRKMRGLYTDEISRLSSVRQELMHGGLQIISTHRSSDEPNKELYILPSKDQSTDRKAG